MLCPNCRRENHTDSAICYRCRAPLATAAAGRSSPEAVPIAPEAHNGRPPRAAGWTLRSGGAASGPFIGRQTELEQLKEALEDALSGEGRLVMLVGEPGIGKTRTSQELDEYARSRQVSVFWGRCYENPGAPPYWPWSQVIRSYAREHPASALQQQMGAGAADIAEVVAEVREHIPSLPPFRTPEDPDQARFRLFDSITNFLKNAAQHRPLVLFLDNLHWADKPSLLLLEFLVQEIAQCRILIVGTYRDIELSRRHPLSDSLAELNRERRFQRIQLKGLSRDQVSHFVQAATGGNPPADLVSAIHRQTEGNPLFITEVVRLLRDEGELGPLGLSAGRPPSISIPDGIKEVIGRRLNRLSESCAQTLAIASVIGREFRVSELERIIDHLPEERLLEVIDEAVATRVVEELPQGTDRYQFTHVLIRETLYDELTGPRRARLHRRIGEALEQLYSPNLDSCLDRLAYHFSEAASSNYAAKAVDYATRAGDRAMEVVAHEEAARYYDMALQAQALNQPVDEELRCRLLLSLGESQKRSGESELARGTFDQTAQIAGKLGLAEHLARAAIGFEDAGFRPGFHGGPAVRLLEAASLALGEGDSNLKARVLGSLARALLFSGSFQQARELTQQGVDMARRLADPIALAWNLNAGRAPSPRPEDLPERLAALTEALGLAHQVNNTDLILDVYSWYLFSLLEAGDIEGLNTGVGIYQKHVGQVRQPFYLYVLESFQASLAIAQGRLEEAEEGAKRSWAIAQRLRGQDHSGAFGMKMFTIRKEQGRLQEVLPGVLLFLQTYTASSAWRPGLALIYSELGLEKEARAEFEHLAANEFSTLPQDALLTVCLAYLTEVCACLGDAPRAATLYRLLRPWQGHNLVVGGGVAYFGSVDRYLGLLAAVRSEWEEAEGHFQKALQMDSRTGARTWLAHSQHEYARMLLTRNASGDREKAQGLLASALKTAVEVGMRALEAKVRSLQDQAPTRAAREPDFPDTLSQREVEVLRLVAAGKSNRDIAVELSITANTAANHVKNILAKTRAANRTEAAAYAMRHGLV